MWEAGEKKYFHSLSKRKIISASLMGDNCHQMMPHRRIIVIVSTRGTFYIDLLNAEKHIYVGQPMSAHIAAVGRSQFALSAVSPPISPHSINIHKQGPPAANRHWALCGYYWCEGTVCPERPNRPDCYIFSWNWANEAAICGCLLADLVFECFLRTLVESRGSELDG